MQTALKNTVSEKARIFIGRQPIFDAQLEVVGYELLFRPGDVDAFDGSDGDKATSNVINNALMEIGLDEIVGDVPAYINFTRELINNGVAKLLPGDRVVLEILETVSIDQDLVDSVNELVYAGYTIALDDFVYSEEWVPLIKLAHIIKIDVMAHSIDEIREQFERFKGWKLKMLAEKVETQEEYNQLKEIGFDYFQGYFFSKPTVLSQEELSSDNLSLLRLMAELQNPDAEIDDIEKLVSQNISLSYKLLRYINSAAFALKSKLTSIKQIIVYFGIQRLKDWVCLIALSGNKDKPAELVYTGLVRARMCELIGEEIDAREKDSFFIVGLFSILEALVDRPLALVLEKLPLDKSINLALIGGKGEMGQALQCAISCEQCLWSDIAFPDISTERISEIYMDATSWSRQALAEIEQ